MDSLDPKTIGHFLTHILEGFDIPKPEALVKVSGKAAVEPVERIPYTFADNLWHTVYWQNIWLDRLKGAPSRPSMEIWQGDWQTADAKEYLEIKQVFIAGLKEARDICNSEPFTHSMKTDIEAAEILIRIATHAAYHVGQLTLIKRALRAK